MLLGKRTLLEEKVVETLARNPDIAVEVLREIISKQNRSYSVQAIYQELRKLERDGIVVRRGGKYSLRFLWLVELGEFASGAYSAYLSSGSMLNDLPAEGERRRWELYDLARVLDLWTDLTFALLKGLPRAERTLCEYVEHIWFHTANPVNEEHFIRAMRREGVQYQLISRNDTYLDRTYIPILKRLNADYSLGRKGYTASRNKYFSVIGEYIISVNLSQAFRRHVSDSYRQISSAEKLSAQAILHFASFRSRCVVELRRCSKKAQQERNRFRRYF